MSPDSLVLVRVVTPDHDHPREGMIGCRDHVCQVITATDPPFIMEVLTATEISFWGHRCLMCGVEAVSDRLCENESCRRPLHPQWPAVYCGNECALGDL